MNYLFLRALIIAACSFSLPVFAAVPGILDTTFNPEGLKAGTESTNINGSTNNNPGRAVAIQTDNKIVVAGTAVFSGGSQIKFGIARFLADGTLDETFNAGGTQPGTNATSIANSSTDSQAFAVAIQADGKIVAAGYANVGSYQFAIARFNADGTLDTTGFNALGTQAGTNIISIGVFSQAFAVVIQPDGKIVLAGDADVGGVDRLAVARFNSDGTPDLSFGGSNTGTNSTTVNNMGYNGGAGVTIQSDGKIVVAGFAGDEAGTVSYFAVARFNTDGTLDTTFNGSGTQAGTNATSIANSTDPSNEALSVAIQSNGKIVLGGTTAVSSVTQFGLAQFNTDGTLDGTFNGGGAQAGTAATIIQNSTSASGAAVAIQQNGKIVIAGNAHVGGVDNFGIARFLADGTLDTLTFNPDDLVQPGTNATLINNAGQLSEGNSVALQSDGKIVMAGFLAASPSQFAVARFNGDAIVPVPPVVTTTTTTDPFALRLIQKYGPRL